MDVLGEVSGSFLLLEEAGITHISSAEHLLGDSFVLAVFAATAAIAFFAVIFGGI
jgi:hypothetical protein